MSNEQLPARASLEYLKKLAKERLHDLRRTEPHAQLAAALLAVAREHGFSSWRSLKGEVERRRSNDIAGFCAAAASGDANAMRGMLSRNPDLSRAASPDAPHGGWTALHAAARGGQTAAVRLLLDHGADPNAREAGDNTIPLHWAAAHAHLDTVRLLLDAGADVHGLGDVHELDVIGWATYFRPPGDEQKAIDDGRLAVVAHLVERGARHHVFSALSIGDPALTASVVEQDPAAMDRRMSRFERGQTPLHFAINRKRYDLLDILIGLGADVDAVDSSGQTALAMAMLRGDREAMRRLHAAGATPPAAMPPADLRTGMSALAGSVKKGVPMIKVPDVARALDWYTSIGFTELARYGDEGGVNFGMVSFGGAELMLNVRGTQGPHDASLWFYTDAIDRLYRLLKGRQLHAAQTELAGQAAADETIQFEQDIEDMFYGARQFCIRDLNGYELYFIQSIERPATP